MKTLSYTKNVSSGTLGWNYVPTTTNTTQFVAPGYFPINNDIPLQQMYPIGNGVTHKYSHHNCAHPGMPWKCPVRAMGGSNPRVYEIVKGPAGMTIGNGVVNYSGDLTISPDYGLLTWNNPIAGSYHILIRCTDQYGRVVTFSWRLVCATSLHLFVAPVARGTGDGSTWANAKDEGSVILNGSTSPSLNKVLVLCGGEYTSTNAIILNKSTGASSVIGYPDETAIWHNKIGMDGDDSTVGFITIKQVGTSDFGIIRSYTACHRLASFYNTFTECFNSNEAQNNNQAVHGYSSAGEWRQNLVMLNNKYIDCKNIFAHDLYNVDSVLMQCEEWITGTNPDLAVATVSVWFSKARYRMCEISFNSYDNPHVSGRSSGIIQTYNGVDGNHGTVQDTFTTIEFNFIRCSNSESGIFSNGAANLVSALATPITMTNTVRRNTIINGGIAAKNYDYGYGLNRRTFLADNILQRSTGTNASITSINGVDDSIWYSNPSMLYGTAIVDSTGKINIANAAYLGLKGAQVIKTN